jgi:bacillithiol biosynthesis deacetylase BshB1
MEKTVTPLDLLVFGPHPDDAEIGLGGTMAKQAARGHRVGICDLTEGELGSNGTPEERLAEGEAARAVLGAVWRGNLGLPDGAIGRDVEHLRRIARAVRALRPRAIAVPYGEDRHPDHRDASRVVREAIFKSGLRRYDAEGEPWRPDWVCCYFINDSAPPSFVVDVSAFYDKKREALACHRSQFAPSGGEAVPTRLTQSTFAQLIESRDAQFGALAGVTFAEGVLVRDVIVREDLLCDWIRGDTS